MRKNGKKMQVLRSNWVLSYLINTVISINRHALARNAIETMSIEISNDV